MPSTFSGTAKRNESAEEKVERGCSHHFFQQDVLSYISNDLNKVFKIHMIRDSGTEKKNIPRKKKKKVERRT